MKYRAVMGAVEHLKAVLIETGAVGDDIPDILERLAKVAGGLLPPVGGTLNLKFLDTRMN